VASPASTASRSLEHGGDSGGHAHPAAKPPGEVVAVTSHDDFLLELGETLGGQVSMRPVESVAAALEHLSGSRRLQLLTIDSRGSSDLRGEVDRAHARAPHVPIIVFAAAETEKSIAGALRSSNVFAVLPIPVDRRKTAAIFEGALAEAADKRRGAGAATASPGHAAAAHGTAGHGTTGHGTAGHARSADLRGQLRAPLVPEAAPLSNAPFSSAEEGAAGGVHRSKPMLIGAALALAAALIGGGIWFFSGNKHSTAPSAASAPSVARAPAGAAGPAATSSTSSPATVSPGSAPGSGASVAAAPGAAAPFPAATPVPAAQGTLDELLEKARLAMRERRYTDPANNCALLYYRSALGVDASNGEARDGMARLAGLLGTRFDEAVTAGHYDEAAEALAGLKVAAPQDSRLAARQAQLLRAEWSNALAGGNTDRAAAVVRQAEQSGAVSAAELARWRAELARHQIDARMQRFADLLNQRIREGRLLEPSDDSAKYYLQQLEQTAPNNPVAQRSARDLIGAYLRKAHDAALAGRSADADKWVAEAHGAGMTAADLAAYQRDLAAARQRAATAESDRLAQLARARIQDGHLIDPSQDSAVYYLNELKSGFGDTPTVESIGRALAARLVEQAASAARAGRLSEVSSELGLAQRWGADPVLVQAVQQIATGHGAPASAAAGAATPQLPPGFTPKRTRYQAPEYPERALDNQISGSVEVAFTLGLDGRPHDVRVTEANPPGVFDRAALSAVSRWRYQPVIIDNMPTEISWRIVIHFQAPKQ
jgi:periplasmic protein TonB